eukprot:2099354-Pyramimonas_sp.AAC.1
MAVDVIVVVVVIAVVVVSWSWSWSWLWSWSWSSSSSSLSGGYMERELSCDCANRRAGGVCTFLLQCAHGVGTFGRRGASAPSLRD